MLLFRFAQCRCRALITITTTTVFKRGGGVAILIRRSLQHELLPCIQTNYVENIGVEITLSNLRKVRIYCVYFPGKITGGLSPVEKRQRFKNDLRKLFSINCAFLIGGDLNCRHRDWGCIRANSWGNVLSELSVMLPMSIMYPPSPTYVPASSRGSSSVIDLFVSNVSSLISQPIAVNELSSDHNPVFCNILRSGVEKVQYYQDLKNANWSSYRTEVMRNLRTIPTVIENISSNHDVDDLIHTFSEHIVNSANNCIPKVPIKSKCIKLPAHILELIRIRNMHRRNWQRYRQPIFRIQMSKTNKLINKSSQAFRNAEWNNKLRSLDKSAKPFWNIVKIVKNKNRQIPCLKNGLTTLYTDSEKAESLASNFSENHAVSQHLGDASTETLVQNAIQAFSANNPETPSEEFVSETDIKYHVDNLQIKKTGGLDNIKNIYIKKLPKKGIKVLTFIINVCLKTQYFPDGWKLAKVVPIQKAGKPLDKPQSYRPISLLSCVSKIYEKILKEKMIKIIEDHKLYPDEQFGFRRGHGTSHQVLRLCNIVKTNRAIGRSTGMILLDIEKAFDSVWHNGLIYKMINLNFPSFLCKIIQSFVSNRRFIVHVNGSVSNVINFHAGVPQGSVLGPVLYNLYTSDFPHLFQCEAAIYADDTAIISSHEFSLNIETNLKNAIEVLQNYYTKWKIKLNAEKTQAIFFTRKRSPCFLPANQLLVNGYSIAWKPSVKYLGVHLDSKLTFKEHTTQTLNKINIGIKILYPFINRKSLLSNENKILIHKTIFQAILLYGCPVWGHCAECHIKKLQIAQNKLLKMMLSLPWHHSTLDVHARANVEMISFRIRKLIDKFKTRCDIPENPLINQLNIEYHTLH